MAAPSLGQVQDLNSHALVCFSFFGKFWSQMSQMVPNLNKWYKLVSFCFWIDGSKLGILWVTVSKFSEVQRRRQAGHRWLTRLPIALQWRIFRQQIRKHGVLSIFDQHHRRGRAGRQVCHASSIRVTFYPHASALLSSGPILLPTCTSKHW